MIFVNFKTYPQGTGEKAVRLARICEKVAKKTKVEIIPVVQVVDLWRIRQAVEIPLFVQHVDLFPQGKHSGWINLEAVMSAGAVGTLLNHSEHPMPPGTIRQILKRVRFRHPELVSGSRKIPDQVRNDVKRSSFQVVVCCKTLGQVARLVKLKPDFLAYEPPELIGSKQISVATAHPRTIEKVVKITTPRGVAVIVGAGIHSAKDVKVSLQKGAVGILLATDVVLAKDPEKELIELAEAFV